MLILLGAGIAVFSLSKSLPVSYAMLVLVGASMMAVFATVTSLVQLITTNEMRGRVMSVYNCAFRGGMPMGNLLSGWLVPMFTAPIVLGVNGVVLVSGGGVLFAGAAASGGAGEPGAFRRQIARRGFSPGSRFRPEPTGLRWLRRLRRRESRSDGGAMGRLMVKR